MKLSIVSTMYKSAPYIEEFHRRASEAASKLTDDFEIVLVNDGSPDEALSIAIELTKRDPRVVIVDLARNFGHHKAMMTGLSYARGERIFLIDCDLEEEPELLLEFAGRMDECGCDVVYGVQATRKGGFIERMSGELFYSAINYLSGIDMPRNIVTARLMSKRYVESLLEYREREVFLAGIWHITGFDQRPLVMAKRHKGSTTYTFRKKVGIIINSVTSFSDRPLRFIFYTGALISVISSLYILNLIYMKLIHGVTIEGWTSLIVSVWLLGGMTISFLGIIGIYLSKVFIEVKARPYSTVRALYGRQDRNDG